MPPPRLPASASAFAFAFAFALAFALAACAPPRPAPPPPPPRIDVTTAADAGPIELSSPARTALGEVTVSFLTDEGGYWGPFYALVPDPVTLVKPCYVKALALRGGTAGWALFEVATPPAGFAKVRFIEGSPLPEPLVACMTEALGHLTFGDSGFMGPPALTYVTLR